MAAAELLQITDTHLLRDRQSRLLGVDTRASMWSVLEKALDDYAPGALLISGDIAHDAETQTYAELDRDLRKLYDKDIRYVCGNHDSITPMHEANLDQSNLRLGDFTLVITDTHAEGEVEGEFSPSDLEALSNKLASSDSRHILVVGHHAPVDIGTPWLDKHRIRGGETLLDCLCSDPRVKGYLFGHIHQEFEARHGELRLFATPSTCFQFLPGSETFSIDSRSAGYRHLRLHQDGRIETQVHRVAGVPASLDSSVSRY